ncbi:MAG: FAD/NAD(P)-binding protein [Cyanobacteriota bacterium]|nr:FAD/NAD(P)-binding protein [Cyanobacteriota bacterium]
MRQQIGVIGGGLSGTLVVVHLLRKASHPLTIHLIERHPPIGRGVAYRTSTSAHLLNIPAGSASAFADQPMDFLQFLQTLPDGKLMGGDPYHFLPRQLYGQYLQSVLQKAIEQASPEVTLRVWQAEAVALSGKGWGSTAMLQLDSGDRLLLDQVVLALGHFPPGDPVTGDPFFLNSQRYRHYAWDPAALSNLEPEATVLLIGSGLTMIDQVLALRAQGHRGLIEVVSRRGRLPLVHRFSSLGIPSKQATYTPLDPLTELPLTVRQVMRRVRWQVKVAASLGQDWRVVLDSLRPHLQALWQSWSITEQKRFLRHVRPYWEIHRHRTAPPVAEQIQQEIKAGSLRLYAGRITAIADDTEGVSVWIRRRQTQEADYLRVARVINCTGSQCSYRKLSHPLIINLQEQGLIRPDPLELGLDTAKDGALLNQAGIPADWLFTLGPPRKGNLWETTAIAEIRLQAEQLAQTLLERSANPILSLRS